MHDEFTIPDDSDETLLRAGFDISTASRAVLQRALGSPRGRGRILALRGLVRHGVVDESLWLACLADDDVDVRREALTQVSQHPATPAVAQRVTDLLDDPDALVVDGAAFALGEFTFSGAVGPLCRVARDHPDARCREAAIAALGAIGDDAARVVIIAALDDKAPVRRRAIVALANFEGPDIEAALERASDDRDWQVRAAVSQLGREDESDA